MKQVIVVGSSYAGIGAALELRARLPEVDRVTVVSPGEDFIFYPALIWVAQGERALTDISFPIRPVLEEAGITFFAERMTALEPDKQVITLGDGLRLRYDKLLIAAGGTWDWSAVPGAAPQPEGHTVSILTPWLAEQARTAWQSFLEAPGPIVIGLALNASLYGAAYELALNLDTALRRAGKRQQASITVVTPEPYLGHFGHDGIGNSRHVIEEAFAQRGIYYETEAQIERVEPGTVVLGKRLPFKLAMIMPPYRGIPPVQAVPGLSDAEGRIPVDDHYRSLAYPDIYAAGTAVQVKPKAASTLLPCGVFVPGTVSEKMGRIAAANLAADLGHGAHEARPPSEINALYVLDSGVQGLFLSLGAQPWLNVQANIPGPWSHWAKIMAEKYQLWHLHHT